MSELKEVIASYHNLSFSDRMVVSILTLLFYF